MVHTFVLINASFHDEMKNFTTSKKIIKNQ